MAVLLVVLAVLVFLTVDYLVQRRRVALGIATAQPQVIPIPVLHTPEYRTPAGVFFDRGHTWAFLEESGNARIGVSDLARTVLGSVDRVVTAPVGKTIRKGETLIDLYHGDRHIALSSPFDGVVQATNTDIDGSGSDRSYVDDWVCTVKPTDTSTLPERLLIGARAKEWLGHEVSRLKVFLSTIAPRHPVLAETMQDGGLPYTGLVEYLNDVDWLKLQETFFRAGDD